LYIDGFIFVVDNTADSKALKKTRKSLETFLSPDPELGMDTTHIAAAPLLVFLCEPKDTTTTSDTQPTPRLNPAELASQLGLMNNLNGRIARWCVRSVSVEKMSGIPEGTIDHPPPTKLTLPLFYVGLHWLANNL